MVHSCSYFVTRTIFQRQLLNLVKNFSLTEGEEWIRKAVRAAAETDTLRSPWTSVESPRA